MNDRLFVWNINTVEPNHWAYPWNVSSGPTSDINDFIQVFRTLEEATEYAKDLSA